MHLLPSVTAVVTISKASSATMTAENRRWIMNPVRVFVCRYKTVEAELYYCTTIDLYARECTHRLVSH